MTASLEDAKIIDIEEWLTLATSPSSTKLKQGQSPYTLNTWVDEKPGSVITAPGYFKVGEIPSGLPVSFCINFFRTSVGTETFVVSDNSTVWTTVDFQNFTSIITGLASAFQLRGLVIRDKLWLTNGSDAVRVYNGSTVIILDGSLGNPDVPKGRYIAYHDERVWLYHIPSNRSQAAFSALTDSAGTIIAPDNTSAWPTSNTLQISEGDADFGTGLILYRGYLHFFKQYSIWRLAGYDEYTYTRVKTRASTGCRFNESLGILDSLVHLIGVDGFYVFDGEETERISDIIDPATASQTAFGFNQLQQPNTNNQFWEVASTDNWNAGTVPSMMAVDDGISLVAADNSQADFQAGVIQTNLDLTRDPGTIDMSHSDTGFSNNNVAASVSAALVALTGGVQIGNTTNLTNNGNSYFGASWFLNSGLLQFSITFAGPRVISKIILRGLQSNTDVIFSFNNGSGNQVITSASFGGAVSSTQWDIGGSSLTSPADVDFNFTAFTATVVTVSILGVTAGRSSAFSHVEAYETAYNTTGKFTSKTFDLGLAPSSYGNLNATETLNGQTASYFTQSSADGSSWGAEVSVANGAAIGSALQRYLRWGANLASSGSSTPQISAVYLPAVYISAIHNTGGSLFAWGPIEAGDRTLPLQIVFYYRTSTTLVGVSSATWQLIVPGGVISDSVLNQYVQFRVEMINGDSTHLPTVPSVTINWIVGTGTQLGTLQNVASTVWRNRYWMAAAGPGATENDTVIVRGKKTFGSPWQLKDFPLLSFTRFHDALYAGSSLDGSIYQIDTGHSKNGVAIDSFFQTGDFTFGGYYICPIELLVEVERSGPYSLTVGFSIDRGSTWTDYSVDLTPSTFAPSYTKKINIATTNTDRIRFRVRTNGVDMPFEVHRLIFYYKLGVSRGSIQ